MKRKPAKSAHGILQTWEMVEITDPAEIAALERRIRTAEKAIAEREKANATQEKSPKRKLYKRK
jgi:hypothetical protein